MPGCCLKIVSCPMQYGFKKNNLHSGVEDVLAYLERCRISEAAAATQPLALQVLITSTTDQSCVTVACAIFSQPNARCVHMCPTWTHEAAASFAMAHLPDACNRKLSSRGTVLSSAGVCGAAGDGAGAAVPRAAASLRNVSWKLRFAHGGQLGCFRWIGSCCTLWVGCYAWHRRLSP